MVELGGSGHGQTQRQEKRGRRGGGIERRQDHSWTGSTRDNGGGSRQRRKVLVLHGNRQTGDLLLGRMSSLKRKANNRLNIEFVAPDAPFLWEAGDVNGNKSARDENTDDNPLRTWWHRRGDEYSGLEQSLDLIQTIWGDEGDFDGIIGFSQGARLAHLITLLHKAHAAATFPGLRFIIFASGYGDVPLPTNFPPVGTNLDELACAKIKVASLHVMGLSDRLVTAESSRALLVSYDNPLVFEHEGGHHIPMQAGAVDTYLSFMESALCMNTDETCDDLQNDDPATSVDQKFLPSVQPEPEQAQAQQDECESMSLIFPDEFTLHSQMVLNDESEYGRRLLHPISYSIRLRPPSDQITDESLWPADIDFALRVSYPPSYPDVPPKLTFDHGMNLLEFKIGQEQACLSVIRDVAKSEVGMPCVMSCVYAAREFFEGGGLGATLDFQPFVDESNVDESEDNARVIVTEPTLSEADLAQGLLLRASRERILVCNLQGLDIANSVLGNPHSNVEALSCIEDNDSNRTAEGTTRRGKGGIWRYTIGLVGKPSAGKSTFFNAASAFARQRGADASPDDDSTIDLGGATMAPHPFTTIDPNIGYCLVPAPPGSCPEDDDVDKSHLTIGSTHGRDSKGRRLLPVMLKDVAGLVPGAYAGRGKGNKFLDDLTDADVLIHVVDASGSSDTEGNKVGFEQKDSTMISGAGSHPLNDLSWIRNELLQWVYSNLSAKWESVSRKGSPKLLGMFSGYRQSQSFVWDIILSVEKYLDSSEGRPHALDNLVEWDEGDLHRLVSAFLGVRFPMALALNKSDLPTAAKYVKEIKEALPIHGAHCAVPLCSKREMKFVRNSISNNIFPGSDINASDASIPEGVWSCLQKAIGLREPILVFPVNDMVTYEPLPGLMECSIGHSSLPSTGMIACLQAAGGSPPSQWNPSRKQYTATFNGIKNKDVLAFRDVLVMKPGSTVEDAFVALKAMGALGGEFVRAEGAGRIREKAKLVKKDDFLCRSNRILRVMSNKRTQWQKKG